MELTAAAQGLNAFFFGYDSALLGALHSVAEGVGVVMTPLMKVITLLGEKGLIFFLLALVFICGIVVIGVQFSIALGFLPDPG